MCCGHRSKNRILKEHPFLLVLQLGYHHSSSSSSVGVCLAAKDVRSCADLYMSLWRVVGGASILKVVLLPLLVTAASCCCCCCCSCRKVVCRRICRRGSCRLYTMPHGSCHVLPVVACSRMARPFSPLRSYHTHRSVLSLGLRF